MELKENSNSFLSIVRELMVIRQEIGLFLTKVEVAQLEKIEAEMAFRNLLLRAQLPNTDLYRHAARMASQNA